MPSNVMHDSLTINSINTITYTGFCSLWFRDTLSAERVTEDVAVPCKGEGGAGDPWFSSECAALKNYFSY